MSEGRNWQWLPQWALTFAVLVALPVAGPVSFYLGSEFARLDEGQPDQRVGIARVETRIDDLATRIETRMDAFETRMATRMAVFETRLESLVGELHKDRRKHRTDMANLRQRVAALEAASVSRGKPSGGGRRGDPDPAGTS